MIKVIPLILVSTLIVISVSTPEMIEEKDEFLEKIKTQNMAIIFYGHSDTEEYKSFEQLIPSYNQLFQGIEFLYVPASKFKLNRNHPSLSIYRKIGGGDWQHYKGGFNREEMDKWIQHLISDPLKELTIEHLEETFRNKQKNFILLSFGEFELLRTKIYLNDFCRFKEIQCWKIEPTSPIYSVVTQLFGVRKEDFGISKLGFYNPATERVELYTKDVWTLKSS